MKIVESGGSRSTLTLLWIALKLFISVCRPLRRKQAPLYWDQYWEYRSYWTWLLSSVYFLHSLQTDSPMINYSGRLCECEIQIFLTNNYYFLGEFTQARPRTDREGGAAGQLPQWELQSVPRRCPGRHQPAQDPVRAGRRGHWDGRQQPLDGRCRLLRGKWGLINYCLYNLYNSPQENNLSPEESYITLPRSDNFLLSY